MQWFVLVIIGASLVSAPSLFATPLSKDAKLKALRQALRSGSETSAKKTKSSEIKATTDFRQTALNELVVQPQALPPSKAGASAAADGAANASAAQAVQGSLATVQTSQLLAQDPRQFRGLQIGLTAQPFQAAGEINLVGIGQRDLSQLPMNPMLGLELKYAAELFSVRAFANYSSQSVRWLSQTGRDLGDTRFNALQTGVLLGRERPYGQWNILGDLGVARFDLVQTGVNSLTEISGGRWLGLARVGAAYPLGPTWLSLSYEHRVPLSSSWVNVATGSWLLGVHYGLR